MEKAMGMEIIEKTKKFRDPIYGYIEIEENIVHDIIDTATFQRLRNVRQTSYAPLYPSSLHNRFVHSLGVYYLGGLAFDAIERSLKFNAEKEKKVLGNLQGLFEDDFSRYKALFKLACLLHDVGHAPFSHTGENFYLSSKSQATFISQAILKKKQDEIKTRIRRELDEEKKRKISKELEEIKKYSIYKHLTYLTADFAFEEPAAQDAAAHEIMSCIVALETFGQDERYFKDDHERSFFARCITGLQYGEAIDVKQEKYLNMTREQQNTIYRKMLLNCLIQLLHSSVIDVDRLDYIIRDASTMGYQSVSVDYRRLLSGLEIVLIDDFNFTIGFHKNAVSVIENAVYAHDNEKKWIQSHPAIIYDSFLVQQAIIYIENQIRIDYPKAVATLFSYDSLTNKGIRMNAAKKSEIHIRYLGDADIIYLMKNVYGSPYAEEYFNRNTRRLPVWKSKAEFRNLFDKDERKTLINAFEIMMTNISGSIDDSFEITENKTLESIRNDIESSKQSDIPARVEAFQKKLEYVERLLALCDKYSIKNVMLLSKAFFKSNFSKTTVSQLPILFPDSDRRSKLEDVSSTLKSEQTGNEKLIYLFYRPIKNREKINASEFSKELLAGFREVRL